MTMLNSVKRVEGQEESTLEVGRSGGGGRKLTFKLGKLVEFDTRLEKVGRILKRTLNVPLYPVLQGEDGKRKQVSPEA